MASASEAREIIGKNTSKRQARIAIRMEYLRFKADHRVTVFRAANNYRLEDISSDVLAIYTTKTYGHAAGGFTILTTFNKRFQGQRYDQLLKPNDVIHIELDGGEGNGLQSRMLGLVDRPSRLRQYSQDGKPTYRVKITGLDFGKLLIKHNCIADISPLTGKIGSEDVIRIAQGVQFSGTPATVVRSAFDALFLNQVPWAKPHFVFSAGEDQDDWQTFDYPILETTGPIWSAMKSMSNEPFNCLTTETYDGKFHVVLEKYPFHPDTGKLTREHFHTIEDRDISFEDLGACDNERINYLYFRAEAVMIFGGSAGAPLQYETAIEHDPKSIPKHGFLPFYPKTNFAPPGYLPHSNAGPDTLQSVRNRAKAFWNRHRLNHELESGTLKVKGSPSIKAGSGAVLAETNMEYFVETVADHYEWGQSYFTNLQVTRGQDHGRG
jgi:hypothetical protein